MKSDTIWKLWLAGVLGSLAVFETPALIRGRRERDKPSGTLTYWWRGVLGTRRGELRRRRWILAPVFGAFCVWLAGHMCLNKWDLP